MDTVLVRRRGWWVNSAWEGHRTSHDVSTELLFRCIEKMAKQTNMFSHYNTHHTHK